MFAITRFRCIEVLFHIFYYYWGQELRTSLYRGSLNRGSIVLYLQTFYFSHSVRLVGHDIPLENLFSS